MAKDLDKIYLEAKTLSENQTITGAWQNCGEKLDTNRYNKITLFFDITINNTEDLQMKLMLLNGENGDEYELPILTTSAGKANVEPLVYEFTNDADGRIALQIEIPPNCFIQCKLQALTVGASAAIVNADYALAMI